MRYLVLTLGLSFFFSLSIIAQHGILVGYYDTHLGKAGAIEYSFAKKIFYFEVGLKYLNYSPKHDNQNNIFKDRAYPQTFIQHLGPIIGGGLKLPVRNSTARIDLFAQVHYLYSGFKNRMYIFDSYSPEGEELYKYHNVVFNEQHNFENILGIGFDFAITKKLYFYNRFGLMIVAFIGVDDRILIPNITSEFGWMFSAGLSYKFLRTEK